MSFREENIRHETKDFWVLDASKKGYEVYQIGITHSTRVASIGHGFALGLPRAIQEADRRQAELDAQRDNEPLRQRQTG